MLSSFRLTESCFVFGWWMDWLLVWLQVNSAVGIVTSGYGVEPPAGMDEKYYAEKKRRHKDWIKKRVNPEWLDRDPETLYR